MFEDVLGAMHDHGCRFVVVGSVARVLAGEHGHPHDLDVVIDTSAGGRESLRRALQDVAAMVETRDGWRRIERCQSLPWEWGFRVWTAGGQIDLIATFIDGTTIEDHDAHATSVVLRPGVTVRINPTRHAEVA